jgi:hypothetical protein
MFFRKWVGFLRPRRPQPTGVDEVTAEAAVLAKEVLCSVDVIQQLGNGMVLLREMFAEGGPLAALRWPWEELAPVVERHIAQVTAEVEDMAERRARLFQRCAPELLSPERVERFERELRRVLMEPGRTVPERRALAVSILAMRGAPRHPPYTSARLHTVAWLMMAQITEWAGLRMGLDLTGERGPGEAPGEPQGTPRSKLIH